MLEASVVGALMDKLIQFKKERDLRDRNLFKDFVEPIWNDFEEVHASYLESLKGYHLLISETGHDLNESHPVFGAINRDVVFSYAERSYLWEVALDPAASNRHSRDFETADDFYRSVLRYMQFPARVALESIEDESPPDDPDFNPMHANIVRRMTSRSLLAVFRRGEDEKSRRLAALRVLEQISTEVQLNYLMAKSAFDALKTIALR